MELIDSGVEWLGKIPAHWTTSKIAALYTLRNEKVSDRDYAPLSVTNKGVVPQLETAAKTDAHDDRKLVQRFLRNLTYGWVCFTHKHYFGSKHGDESRVL